jgi:hypothetical protein
MKNNFSFGNVNFLTDSPSPDGNGKPTALKK